MRRVGGSCEVYVVLALALAALVPGHHDDSAKSQVTGHGERSAPNSIRRGQSKEGVVCRPKDCKKLLSATICSLCKHLQAIPHCRPSPDPAKSSHSPLRRDASTTRRANHKPEDDPKKPATSRTTINRSQVSTTTGEKSFMIKPPLQSLSVR